MDGHSHAACSSVPPHGRSRGERLRGAVIVVGLLASSALVWQSTQAAFSATTSNGLNEFGAGTVTIEDNDAGSAMFTVPALKPGDTGTVCMGVRYTGSLTPSAIKLYTSGAVEKDNGGAYGAWANDATSEMDNNVNMLIKISDTDLAADPGNNCAPAGVGLFTDVSAAAPGTDLQTMIGTETNFATGFPSQWGTITVNKWRVWKFTYTYNAAAPNSSQGDGVKLNFVWEAQS